jgi:hypothetical protein
MKIPLWTIAVDLLAALHVSSPFRETLHKPPNGSEAERGESASFYGFLRPAPRLPRSGHQAFLLLPHALARRLSIAPELPPASIAGPAAIWWR